MKIRIKKLSELPNALYPNNIEVDYEKIFNLKSDLLFEAPKVGEAFLLFDGDNYFRSSVVKEIIDENTFKTMNSIYRWEKLDENTI